MTTRMHNKLSFWKVARTQGLPTGSVLLEVRVDEQRVIVWSGGRVRVAYRISTARKGVGGARRFPLYASGLARGRIVYRRRPAPRCGIRLPSIYGEVLPRSQWRSPAGPDRILTRILWLRGREPGRNRGPGVDSYRRFIYVHGTNQEQHLAGPPRTAVSAWAMTTCWPCSGVCAAAPPGAGSAEPVRPLIIHLPA